MTYIASNLTVDHHLNI